MDANAFIPPQGLTTRSTPRAKQAIFRPLRIAVLVALAHRIDPLPTLIVQFDKYSNVRAWPEPTA